MTKQNWYALKTNFEIQFPRLRMKFYVGFLSLEIIEYFSGTNVEISNLLDFLFSDLIHLSFSYTFISTVWHDRKSIENWEFGSLKSTVQKFICWKRKRKRNNRLKKKPFTIGREYRHIYLWRPKSIKTKMIQKSLLSLLSSCVLFIRWPRIYTQTGNVDKGSWLWNEKSFQIWQLNVYQLVLIYQLLRNVVNVQKIFFPFSWTFVYHFSADWKDVQKVG